MQRLSLLASSLFAASCLALPAAAQLTNLTNGTVPRIATPSIQPCSTAPEPYYFQVQGTVSRQLQPNEEIRLLIRPILLNGGPIFGCEWISQCFRPTPDAQGNFTAVGQFGTNGQQRSWFSGAQADAQFAIVDTNAGVGVCIANPQLVSVAISNVTRINIDPSIPTLFDFQIPCAGSAANVQGTPTPGQTVTWQLPQQGAVIFGFADTTGFLFQGCQIYFTAGSPLVVVNTDATGLLSLPIPMDPALLGTDVGTQGIQVTGGVLDMTQPTYVSIR